MSREQRIQLKVLPVTKPSQLQRATELFLTDCQARGLSSKTLRGYRQYLGWLVEYLEAHDASTLEDVTPLLLRQYLVDMAERGLSDGTRASAARIWRVFFHFLLGEELLDNDPMRRVKTPGPSKKILPALSRADALALQDAAKTPRDKAMLLVWLDTGCRLSEFAGLNCGDVDGKTVTVRQGKRKKDRYVFLGNRARSALARYLFERGDTEPSAPLWVSERTGERLTSWGCGLVLRRLGKKAGVHVSPHAIRRTFCLWAHRKGMDLEELRRIMGHENLAVIRKYLDMEHEDLAEAHASHGPVDGFMSK